MLESVVPDPTPDERTAILVALSRNVRAPRDGARPAAWTVGMRDNDPEYDDLRSAARARARRPP